MPNNTYVGQPNKHPQVGDKVTFIVDAVVDEITEGHVLMTGTSRGSAEIEGHFAIRDDTEFYTDDGLR